MVGMTGISSGSMRKAGASEPAQQESRLTARTGTADMIGSPGLHPGTAGIRPPAAQGASVEKPERAPRQDANREEPKPDKGAVNDPVEEKKEDDASE